MTERGSQKQFVGNTSLRNPTAESVRNRRVFAQSWILGLTIVGLGLFLRWRDLSSYWINPDEGIYYSIITAPSFSQSWNEIQGNAHPPFFYLLLRSIGVFSNDISCFRLVSLFFGATSIFSLYLLGRAAAGIRTGVFAALLLSISPSAIEQSQIIRPYMMLVTFLSLALFFYICYLRDRKRRWLVGYSLFFLLATLTHYSSFLVIGALGLHFLGFLGTHRFTRAELISVLVANLPLLAGMSWLYFFHARPHLIDSALQQEAAATWLEPFMIKEAAGVWLHTLGFMRFMFGLGFEGPALILFLIGLGVAWAKQRYLLVTLPITILTVAAVLSAMEKYPFGCSRHSLYLSEIVILPLAFLLSQASASRRLILPAVVLVGSLLFFREPMSALLGAEKNPNRALTERILTEEDRKTMHATLQHIESTPGLVVMTMQTYYFLIPYFDSGRDHMEWSEDRTYFRFPWGKRQVLVNFVWEMRSKPEPVVPGEWGSSRSPASIPLKLYRFLERVDVDLPELRCSRQSQTKMIFGGWTMPLAHELVRFNQFMLPQEKMIAWAGGVSNLTCLQIDLARFMSAMGWILKQRGIKDATGADSKPKSTE